jgi:pyruvate dehydrogenase E1 component beta subunit
MKKTFMSLAISDAIATAMHEDPSVFVFGEDIDKSVLGPTKGLVEEFGRTRVRNTPISEQAVLGSVIGAAASGLRPVLDFMFGGFFYVAMDQIINQLAHIPYMSGGSVQLPVVIMAGIGPEGQAGGQHSESPHATLMQASGLKVVAPSTPADAKGLMLSAIRDPNPVVYLMDISLSAVRGEVPDGEHVVPIGKADVKREGDEVTVAAMASAVPEALKAAGRLEGQGVSVEVIDLRTLVPLDIEAVLSSVRKTGRLVVAETGRRTCGLAAEVITLVIENGWDALREPPIRVTWPDVPVPFSPALEAACRVRERDIVAAVGQVLQRTRAASG